MHRLAVLTILLVLAGCQTSMSPELLKQYQGRTLYTCCNIFHEQEEVSDANYHVGTVVPLGAPVQVQSAGRSSLTVVAGGNTLTLVEAYGKEPFQQYIDKILVAEDPKLKLAAYPKAVQAAVNDGRVEVGMTKEQVIMSLGYPPTHRTGSTAANDWTYWMNRWITYRVQFDESGKVVNIVGTNTPSRNQPIVEEKPAAPPRRAPAPPKKRK